MAVPNIGEEWIYRLRDYAPSERVRITDVVQQAKKKVRIEVCFVDGDNRVESVPQTRLRGLWAGVAAYDEKMSHWAALHELQADKVEQMSLWQVFDAIIPESAASLMFRPVECAVEVSDSQQLSAIIGTPVQSIAERCYSFTEQDDLIMSPDGAIMIAELACRRYPEPVLDIVLKEEAEARERCKNGRVSEYARDDDGEYIHISPEREWARYQQDTRPRLELLRQWCGYRAVTFDERLRAAESEARRLDLLLARAIEELGVHDERTADSLTEAHEKERITPERIRPVIDRPLAPWEMPFREIRVRGRRWW